MAFACGTSLPRRSAQRDVRRRYRADFPILQRVHGKPLVYLDNAATSQKPRGGHRRDRRYYESRTPTSTAACTS